MSDADDTANGREDGRLDHGTTIEVPGREDRRDGATGATGREDGRDGASAATGGEDGHVEHRPRPGADPSPGREDRRADHGATLAAISRRMVGLLKEYYGKGPTKARTVQSGDLVVVVLSGGYTQAERTLIEQGRAKTVMDVRAQFQEVMGPRFKRVIHEELRREVVAFMSATHADPDYNVELFILAPRDGDGNEPPIGDVA